MRSWDRLIVDRDLSGAGRAGAPSRRRRWDERLPHEMRRSALLTVAMVCLAQAPACTTAHGAPVRVVLTTLHPPRSPAAACDRCLADQHDLRLKAGTVASDAITVDATQRFQKIDGFGLAMT